MGKPHQSRREFNRGIQARTREASRVEEETEICRCYTIKEKIKIVVFAMVRMEEDLALINTIADEVGISGSSLS